MGARGLLRGLTIYMYPVYGLKWRYIRDFNGALFSFVFSYFQTGKDTWGLGDYFGGLIIHMYPVLAKNGDIRDDFNGFIFVSIHYLLYRW